MSGALLPAMLGGAAIGLYLLYKGIGTKRSAEKNKGPFEPLEVQPASKLPPLKWPSELPALEAI